MANSTPTAGLIKPWPTVYAGEGEIITLKREIVFILTKHYYCDAQFPLAASRHDTARHDECSKRDMSVTTNATGAIRNFVCIMYKVLIAVIRFNKQINLICELK